jgi:hypothetical protein
MAKRWLCYGCAIAFQRQIYQLLTSLLDIRPAFRAQIQA